MELREKMQEKFQWMRFYTPKGRPIGPHPVPMWEADFGSYENRNLWSDVRDFIEEEHGNLSVLIHPHSLDGDYADHTKNSFWAGEVLDLRIQGWKH
jgi:DOPA 4,5-dioxygenase